MEKKFKFHKISPLLKQLVIDLRPSPERLNIKTVIEEIAKKDIENFCKKNGDENVYQKMISHELTEEPVEKVIVVREENGNGIEKKYFNKLLVDLGYNVNVLFSKNHGCDYEAAVNINGYSIPGWGLLVKILRKMNSNIAAFIGKRFAPGRSRLHIRIYEGKDLWYVIAHIDEYNWLNFNFCGIRKSHIGSGQGDYKNGNKYFVESLRFYFKVQ